MIKLEDFSEPLVTAGEISVTDDARMAAYDNGYAAGWEDAAAAQTDSRATVETAAMQALSTLAFSHHEARSHILGALEPLLQAITAHFLPALAQQTLGPLVLDTLLPLAHAQSDAPLVLAVNPAARDAVEMLATNTPGLTVRVVDGPRLTPAQVMLSAGQAEAEVDLDSAIAAITTAIRDFYTLTETENPDVALAG